MINIYNYIIAFFILTTSILGFTLYKTKENLNQCNMQIITNEKNIANINAEQNQNIINKTQNNIENFAHKEKIKNIIDNTINKIKNKGQECKTEILDNVNKIIECSVQRFNKKTFDICN